MSFAISFRLKKSEGYKNWFFAEVISCTLQLTDTYKMILFIMTQITDTYKMTIFIINKWLYKMIILNEVCTFIFIANVEKLHFSL